MKRALAIVLAASVPLVFSINARAADPTSQTTATEAAPAMQPSAQNPAPAPAPTTQTADAHPASPSWLMHPRAESHDEPAPSPSHGRFALAVVLAAALAGVAVWSKRKKKVALARTGVGLRVVDAVRIGPKAQLVVASCGGKSFVLAVTETQVRRIASLEAALAREPAREPEPATDDVPEESPAPLARDFASLVRSLVRPDSIIERHAQTLEKLADPQAPREELHDEDDSDDNAELERVESTQDAIARRSSRKTDRIEAPKSRASAIEGQAAGLFRLRARRA